MRFLIQRVTKASVTVEEKTVGNIGKGFLVFVGISKKNDKKTADFMIKKLLGLRIFDDEDGKTNLSLSAVGGELLLISQFTLYADCSEGNRPSFFRAGDANAANEIYEYIISECSKSFHTEKGIFGAHMKVELLNDGPFTVLLDSDELTKGKKH